MHFVIAIINEDRFQFVLANKYVLNLFSQFDFVLIKLGWNFQENNPELCFCEFSFCVLRFVTFDLIWAKGVPGVEVCFLHLLSVCVVCKKIRNYRHFNYNCAWVIRSSPQKIICNSQTTIRKKTHGSSAFYRPSLGLRNVWTIIHRTVAITLSGLWLF